MKKNVTGQIVCAQLIAKADGSDVTTGTTDVYVLGDGAIQALSGVSPSGAVHEGNGLWSFMASAADTNYDHVVFTFKNSLAITASIQIYTSFPQTGDNYARLGAPAGPSVSADIAAAKVDTAAIKTKTDFLPSATAGAAGGVFIAGSNAATTANITGNLTGNVTGSVGSVTGAVGSVTGNVGGNVVGSVASVAADVGITQAAADKAWSTATRLLTAGTNIVLTKGVGVTGFNDLDASGVRGAVGLASANLDTQIGTLATASALTTVGNNVTTVKTVTDLLNQMLEVGSGSPTYYRFTAGAIELAPTGGSAPSAATIADAVWDEARAGHVAAGSFGEGVVVSDKTGFALSTAGYAAAADKLLGRNLAGGSDGTRTVQDALRSLRNKTSIAAGTLTVCAEDDSTPAWTAAVTTTPGDPLSAIDPT